MPETTMRFKSNGAVIPGGIQFDQREIGWSAPYPLSENVHVLANRVQQLRLNNPVLVRLHLPTDLDMIEQEIVDYNCARVPASCVQFPGPVYTPEPRRGGCSGCGG